MRVAVIQYPGSNCEYETYWALKFAGLDAEIFRWNKDPEELKKFSAYVLSGGFSYQDRVRAGAIAAKKPIMKVIMEEAEKGKPVLGICNGAQILVESGMIPGIKWGEVEMALAPNTGGGRAGYYCNWVFLKCEVEGSRCAISAYFKKDEVIPMPVAHAEGRFTTRSEEVIKKLLSHNQIVFRYCTSQGEIREEFPYNPNGSIFSIAGICNPQGNVVAMMPHPERATWIRQIPDDLDSPYSLKKYKGRGSIQAMREPGPGYKVFLSLREYIKQLNLG